MINSYETLATINNAVTNEMDKKKTNKHNEKIEMIKEYISNNIGCINEMTKVLKNINNNSIVRKHFEKFSNYDKKNIHYVYSLRCNRPFGLMRYNGEFSLGVDGGRYYGDYNLYIKPDGKIIFIRKDNPDITYDIDEFVILDDYQIAMLELAYESVGKLEKQINRFFKYLKNLLNFMINRKDD